MGVYQRFANQDVLVKYNAAQKKMLQTIKYVKFLHLVFTICNITIIQNRFVKRSLSFVCRNLFTGILAISAIPSEIAVSAMQYVTRSLAIHLQRIGLVQVVASQRLHNSPCLVMLQQCK